MRKISFLPEGIIHRAMTDKSSILMVRSPKIQWICPKCKARNIATVKDIFLKEIKEWVRMGCGQECWRCGNRETIECR